MLIAALGWQFQAFLAGFESFRSPLHGSAARVLGYNHWIRVARCSTVISPSILRRFPRFEGSGSTNESDRDEGKLRADARTKNSGRTGGRRHFWRPRPQNRATMAVRGGFDSLLHSFSFFAASSRTYRSVPVFDSIFAWLPGVL